MRRETVHSELTQREKRDTIENDRRVRRGATYHAFAANEADAIRGRYGAISKSHVTGGDGPTYPTLPETSPWHHDPVPPEEQLGVDLSLAPIVGEPHEVAASFGDTGMKAMSSPDEGGGVLRADMGPLQSRVRRLARRRRSSTQGKG